MNVKHHPAEETLAAFTAGNLDEGRSVVVAAHVAMCSSCQRLARGMEHLAGSDLETTQETALSQNALPSTLARLDLPLPARWQQLSSNQKRLNDLDLAPISLQPYELGPWQWISRGVYWRAASVPVDNGARVFLLKAAPGTKLPRHTHTGNELTLVLKGTFTHELGRYCTGDLDDADETIKHQPVVDAGEECICLVAMNGQLRLLGITAPIFQPFVRF